MSTVPKNPKTERVSLGPQVGPNARLALRDRDGEPEMALAIPVRDGVPIPDGAEILQVENPDCTCGGWQDATVMYGPDDRRATESGPAQVATESYRVGHDRIFGKKPTVGLA